MRNLLPDSLNALNRDASLLFLTRFTRLFAYGALSVILVIYLASIQLLEDQIGLLLTLIMAGDLVISLFLTTQADRLGRRRMLIAGAILMVAAGVAFASTTNFFLLVIAGTIGVLSPSGNEVGPFLSIEQAALSHVVPQRSRTDVFAWYTLTGSLATALGALFAGSLAGLLQKASVPLIDSYRAVVLLYALLGLVLALLFWFLSSAAEPRSAVSNLITTPPITTPSNEEAPPMPVRNFLGVHESRNTVLKLSSLFALDSFAGGFVIQSFAAYWFYLRYGLGPGKLGVLFFCANILAGISALLATRLAARIGLVKTMVFTHLPSNILLILVPLMPNRALAVLVLLLRFSISQMDVPTRQSYTMAVVRPEERSAAGGITGAARTAGAAISPFFAGLLFSRPLLMDVPFFIAGGLKIIYDLILYRAFVSLRPPEERD